MLTFLVWSFKKCFLYIYCRVSISFVSFCHLLFGFDSRDPCCRHIFQVPFFSPPFSPGLSRFISLYFTFFTPPPCPIFLLSLLFVVGCLTFQQQVSVSQGRICADNFTCCHTEIEVADPTFHLTQSQYTDTGPTSPSADPVTQGAWQGRHWSANVEVTGMTRPRQNLGASGIRTRDLPLSRRTPYH